MGTTQFNIPPKSLHKVTGIPADTAGDSGSETGE